MREDQMYLIGLMALELLQLTANGMKGSYLKQLKSVFYSILHSLHKI